MPMATKLGRVVIYHEELLPIKSLMIFWLRGCARSRFKLKTYLYHHRAYDHPFQTKKYLHYPRAYDHPTWEDGNLLRLAPVHKVTWRFDYIDLEVHVSN